MEEKFAMQIVNGIAEAVNGDGNSEQLMEDIGLDGGGNITVLLADMPQDRLSELVAEIQYRISHLRVNPFSMIEYNSGRTVTFCLKPEEEIRRLHEMQQW